VADINDRLERLNRREEFARRGHHGLHPPAPDVELDDDFVEVLAAVSRVVQRHPGLSVMVAPADGRPGRTVIRVTERAGSVETVVVPPPPPPAPPPAPPPPPRNGNAALGEPAGSWARPERAATRSGRHADDRYREPPAPAPAEAAPGHHAVADRATQGLVTLTDETSRVVARLAQMLREDPSLASGWVRERSP
jgi:hypothetical protein